MELVNRQPHDDDESQFAGFVARLKQFALASFCLWPFCDLGLLGRFLARVALSSVAMQTINDHLYYYQSHTLRAWQNMTPAQYGYLLITIAVIGWIMMKSGSR